MNRKLRLAIFALLLAAPAVRADDPVDSVMEHSPELARPRIVRTFAEKLPELWIEALARPEVEHRCRAAAAIASAHERGMTGLKVAIPALTREIELPGQHSSVTLAAAKALIVLDARDSATALFKLASTGDIDLREIIEPALARWNYGPAREEWLKRLTAPESKGRGLILAIRATATVGETKAIPRLRELVLAPESPPEVRLEAAKSLGVLRSSGAEADADRTGADATPRGHIGRLAAVWMLRQHSGDETVRRLRKFAVDPEPSVVAVAVARLVELDPALVEPVLASVLANADANVRSLGVTVLAKRPSDDHIRLLGERLSDAHPDVRSQARVALRELAAKFSAPVIHAGDLALAGKDWRGREQAAILFAHLGHKPAADRLVTALADVRPEVAIASAWALRLLAVPETLPKALTHFKQNTSKMDPPDWRDRQLMHLAQFFGLAKYEPADAALRALIPPKVSADTRTRAAACWALGHIHEGKSVPALAAALSARLGAVGPPTGPPLDLEHDLVRTMCAISLGRMGAKDQLTMLRTFYKDAKPSLNPVNNACGWSIEKLTGEKVPPAGIQEFPQRGYFLEPWG